MMNNKHLDKLHSLPLNWSSISSFEYNRERWFRNFILGEKSSSEEMSFGTMIDKKIQVDPTFMPNLPRYELMQHKMTVMFNGIQLMGTPDGINLKKNKQLADYKTGRLKWDRKRAQDHGQLVMYLLLLYITEKVKPEEFDCFIHWLPTKLEENGNFERKITLISETEFKTFKVKHTMQDLLAFGLRIKKTYAEMELYVQNHDK